FKYLGALGVLLLPNTLAKGGSRKIRPLLSGGPSVVITLPADDAAVPGGLFFVHGYTDQVASTSAQIVDTTNNLTYYGTFNEDYMDDGDTFCYLFNILSASWYVPLALTVQASNSNGTGSETINISVSP